jgi:hypothetical protein
MSQFIFMVYIIGLILKSQINWMQFLEEFKASEILCVTTFGTICTFNFDTKCVHSTMETLLSSIYVYMETRCMGS